MLDSTELVLRGQRLPDLLLGLKSRDTVEGGVHVTRRDTVNTDAVLGPLSGNGLGKLDDTSLRGVVAALLLRVVDNGARHRGNEDERAGLASSHHSATNRLGHEESASEVDVDEAAEHGRVVSLGLDVGVGNTGSIDKHVGSAVHVDHGVDSSVDRCTVTDVDLEEGHRQARLLVEFSGS